MSLFNPWQDDEGADGGAVGEVRSISELTAHIKALLQSDANLQDVWVRGEVSNMKPAASGHWYFTLKDEQAALSCV
ncbi:exodeoxyribonuclease VII large subunit, partial [bacterium]|nr:exodeoxyribonuclease VII large subunit [bacterium]